MNAIAFHPVHGTLATVGSDGRFSFWDKDARTKLKTSEQLDQPITACCFNNNGNIFAYSSSYDWSKVRHNLRCATYAVNHTSVTTEMILPWLTLSFTLWGKPLINLTVLKLAEDRHNHIYTILCIVEEFAGTIRNGSKMTKNSVAVKFVIVLKWFWTELQWVPWWLWMLVTFSLPCLSYPGSWVLQPPEEELHLLAKRCRGAEASEQEMVRAGQPSCPFPPGDGVTRQGCLPSFAPTTLSGPWWHMARGL